MHAFRDLVTEKDKNEEDRVLIACKVWSLLPALQAEFQLGVVNILLKSKE